MSTVSSRRPGAAKRRAEIVAAAAKLFDRVGYAQASLGDLAAAVGIAKPTLYHYFESKDEILFEIHDEFISLLTERHESRLAQGALAEDQLLLEVMGDILELMETHHGHVRTFFEHHRELNEEARREIRRKRDRYAAMVEQLIADGIERGIFRSTDPRLATLATFGICNWAYQWYRGDGRLRPREIAYYLWDFVVDGLRPRDDSTEGARMSGGSDGTGG